MRGSEVNVEMRYDRNPNEMRQATPPPPASAAASGAVPVWEEHYDETYNLPFWFNTITDECTWDRPAGLAQASSQASRYSFSHEGTASCSSDEQRSSGEGAGASAPRISTRRPSTIGANIDFMLIGDGARRLRIDPYILRPWKRVPPAPPVADQYTPAPPPKPPWWSPRLWLMTLIGSAFYGVLFVPFIFAILQEAASEGRAITPFGSEVFVSRGAWVASFVFLGTVSIYTMGVFNMVLSAYMYSILLFSVVLLVLLQQVWPLP